MKTQVSDTSIATYHDIKADGTVNKRQSQVLAVMKEGRDYSLQELVMLSGLPINVVSGRVNELKNADHLENGETRRCSITRRTVHPVRLVTRQQMLIEID